MINLPLPPALLPPKGHANRCPQQARGAVTISPQGCSAKYFSAANQTQNRYLVSNFNWHKHQGAQGAKRPAVVLQEQPWCGCSAARGRLHREQQPERCARRIGPCRGRRAARTIKHCPGTQGLSARIRLSAGNRDASFWVDAPPHRCTQKTRTRHSNALACTSTSNTVMLVQPKAYLKTTWHLHGIPRFQAGVIAWGPAAIFAVLKQAKGMDNANAPEKGEVRP